MKFQRDWWNYWRRVEIIVVNYWIERGEEEDDELLVDFV